jgi:fatty-acyl-CoA synthase
LIKDRLDVFPSVVEGCLLKHPNIKEAIVFGIPINDFEQEICAWVKLRSNEDKTSVEEIVKHCQSNLLEFQVPRYVKIVESFPISQMGKYLRNEMTLIYRKELGL